MHLKQICKLYFSEKCKNMFVCLSNFHCKFHICHWDLSTWVAMWTWCSSCSLQSNFKDVAENWCTFTVELLLCIGEGPILSILYLNEIKSHSLNFWVYLDFDMSFGGKFIFEDFNRYLQDTILIDHLAKILFVSHFAG